MNDVFSVFDGSSPLLISIPHDGRQLAPGMREQMTDIARNLPDTDWHVRKLYSFAKDLGASVIAANYSRYVVDLNRPANDAALYASQIATGLCPAKTFAGDDIYQSGNGVSAEEQSDRVHNYWQPYHQKLSSMLAAIRSEHGYALLWDAHSISGEVPLLFDGQLPDLNLGTNDGKSCLGVLADSVMSVAESSCYSAVLNARFRGGYITRNYGAPELGINAIQLELSQRNYMNEANSNYDDDLATSLGETIQQLLDIYLRRAAEMQLKKGC